ncbi:acyl-CoA dehydrogenase [Streptomyces sp. AM 2-1-1]|uniref:acyl-CoA dehydrogenase family protein n=1 Tax=Streptomyces sp. AM 2-1-1 TaxID=3028709 RepID=UPI0031BA9ADB
MTPPPAPAPSTAVRDALTTVLFGPDFRTEHAFWRKLTTTEPFRRRTCATPREQLDLGYARLRLINRSLDSAARLACDVRALTALHEWLGPVDPTLTTLAGIHYNLFLGSLLDHDPEGRRDLSAYLRMDEVGTFLCTEVAHGNDVTEVETTATYDHDRDGFVVRTPHARAQKFMPNTSEAGGPKSGLVAARLVVDGTDHGVFLLLVPLTDGTGTRPGVRVRPLPARMGSPVDHCLTSFDDCFVARTALLAGVQGHVGDGGEFGSALASRRRRLLVSIGRVTPGKLAMSACAVGSARVALALAVRYAGHRRVAGPRGTGSVPVYAHRTHHGPLADALATVFAMSLLHRRALDRWESSTDADGRADAERLVAVAKGWITWRARDVIVECRERCGAQGLLEHNGLAELVTGIEGTITAEGDNLAVQAKAAAEMLLSAPDAVGERSGEGEAPVGDLRDPAFLRGLLADTEAAWFARARSRMSAAPPGDALGRWNAASGAALRGVEAHAARQAAEAFATSLAALPEGPARRRLAEVERLFLLRQAGRAAGELLAVGRVTAEQVRALPDLYEEAVAAVAAHAPALVESFALPDEVFADRPIAGAAYADAHDDPAGPWHRTPVRTAEGATR